MACETLTVAADNQKFLNEGLSQQLSDPVCGYPRKTNSKLLTVNVHISATLNSLLHHYCNTKKAFVEEWIAFRFVFINTIFTITFTLWVYLYVFPHIFISSKSNADKELSSPSCLTHQLYHSYSFPPPPLPTAGRCTILTHNIPSAHWAADSSLGPKDENHHHIWGIFNARIK